MSSCSFLLHVCPPHQLGPVVEALTPCLLQVKCNCLECLLEVTLLSVEHDSTASVVGPHHLYSESVYCWLKVRLLCTDHHPHVLFLGILENGVESVDHVPELLFFLRSQGTIIISSDQWFHLTGLQVWHLKGISKALAVYEAGPVEQMDKTLTVIDHLVQELLDIIIVIQIPGLERFFES